jgi:ribosomal protein S18 acetylase RimI-like enzyme
MRQAITIRPKTDADRDWIDEVTEKDFGATTVVSAGKVHRPADLEGLIAEDGEARVGLAALHPEDDRCELVSINSLVPGRGVGQALLESAKEYARARGCRTLWLVTTNDNTRALRMYQRAGMRISAVRLGAIKEARRIKPEIPLLGDDGIPIRDEIELAIHLD